MEGTKIVKAYCEKSNQYFGLEVLQCGFEWEVVNLTHLSNEEAGIICSEVSRPEFKTHKNLLPCLKCGSRTVGGCSCSKKMHRCSRGMKYQYDCIYCENFKIDYSAPSAVALRGRSGEKVKLSQGKEVKIVTFSNVEWKMFDNIPFHENGARFGEPKVHVIASKENIEFHGYNISAMDEGVRYTIPAEDDFEIECDINTSTIKPHPGGNFYVKLGIVAANINLSGGEFYIGDRRIASVGARFRMKLSVLKGGFYEVFIDEKKVGEENRQSKGNIEIVFGFKHDSHYCELLSHAYVTEIKMQQRVGQ